MPLANIIPNVYADMYPTPGKRADKEIGKSWK